jgi:hypothetical protein
MHNGLAPIRVDGQAAVRSLDMAKLELESNMLLDALKELYRVIENPMAATHEASQIAFDNAAAAIAAAKKARES